MDEHDDDVEPEVEADAEIEGEEFPILDDEDDDDTAIDDLLKDIDTDESEI